jgi:transcriptional regulator with XRE-family HTH domain
MIAHAVTNQKVQQKTPARPTPLQYQRWLRGWSQQDVVDALTQLSFQQSERRGVLSEDTLSRWERGKRTPSPFYRKLLCQLYGLTTEQLGISAPPRVNAKRAMHSLQYQRLLRGWTQQDVANELAQRCAAEGKFVGVTPDQISQWERGVERPGSLYRKHLSLLYGLTVEQLGFLEDPPHPLAYQRLLRGWSQQDVAHELAQRCAAEGKFVGITETLVSRWERGKRKPSPIYRKHLCIMYGVTADKLGLIPTLEEVQA